MKATELLRTRVALAEDAFAELVLWRVPTPVQGSTHAFKYRLAYVVASLHIRNAGEVACGLPGRHGEVEP